MKKRITLIIVSLLLSFLLISAGCIDKKNSTPSATEQLRTDVTKLQTQVATLSEQVANLRTQTQKDWQPTTTQLQTELATANATLITLNAKLTALEQRVITLEKNNSGYTTPTPTPSQPVTITVETFGQQVQLGKAYVMQLKVTNSSTTGQKVNIRFQATRAQVGYTQPDIKVSSVNTKITASSGYIYPAGGTFTMSFSPSPVANVSTNCILIQGISDGYLQMGPGISVVVPITFTLDYVDANICPWDISVQGISTTW